MAAVAHGSVGRHSAPALTDQLILSAARQLAVEGNYRGASAVLDLGLSAEALESVTLLRAKMAAQEARFDDAIAAWRLVLSKDPNQGEAIRGIVRAEKLARRPASKGFRSKRGLLFGAVSTFSLLLAVLVGARIAQRQPAELVAVGDRPARVDKQTANVDTTVRANVPPTKPVARSAQDALRPILVRDLRIPDVSVRDRGGDLVLIFERGVFGAGRARIRADSLPTLRAVARALRQPDRRIQIVVSGVTDPAPPRVADYRDNEALALARAAAVVDFLLAAGVPASVLTLQVANDGPAPFPNDTATNRARNRSVVIRISIPSGAS